MKNTIELLIAARALIVSGWTQGCFARDANDRNCPFGGPGAVKFCMSGALRHLSKKLYDIPHEQAIKELMKDLGKGMWVATWNDEPERTQQDVLAAYDRTIARLTSAAGSGTVVG